MVNLCLVVVPARRPVAALPVTVSHMRRIVLLFDCDALGQIAGLVDVTPAKHRGVVGQQL